MSHSRIYNFLVYEYVTFSEPIAVNGVVTGAVTAVVVLIALTVITIILVCLAMIYWRRGKARRQLMYRPTITLR